MTTQEKIDLIKKDEDIALLAPTFAIDFKYPNIIGMLKKLGFQKVTELTYGARMVNWAYANYVKEHPNQKLFIASPCPTVVAMVKAQYPDLVQYLMPVLSPMAAMGKIYRKEHKDCNIIFISPCWAKENIEAPKYKDYITAVITLKELKEIFEKEGIKEEDFEQDYYFDSYIREYTKIYPVSGGLASTSHIQKLFKSGEILITDGPANIKKALDDFVAGKSPYRFMDLLNCDGGCIGGPAINNKDMSTEKKKEIIFEYTHRSSEAKMGEHQGKVDYAEDLDFSTTF